jgi:hypothetical protein
MLVYHRRKAVAPEEGGRPRARRLTLAPAGRPVVVPEAPEEIFAAAT